MLYPLVVKKAVLVYGLAGALLIVALRLVEYRFLVLEHSVQIYGALVASLFAGLGIWLGDADEGEARRNHHPPADWQSPVHGQLSSNLD